MIRASDSSIVRGNSAHLLVDGPAAFAAWLRALADAERWIHLENYIIRDDRTGRLFRDVLTEKARAGVRVRVLYDWLGCWATPARFWSPLKQAGAEVRAFAPPSFSDPLNGLRRDHRKVLCVDGSYASVAGMCIGDEWAGDPEQGIPPWRDMGVEVRGPAAALIDGAFARSWSGVGARQVKAFHPMRFPIRRRPGALETWGCGWWRESRGNLVSIGCRSLSPSGSRGRSGLRIPTLLRRLR